MSLKKSRKEERIEEMSRLVGVTLDERVAFVWVAREPVQEGEV